MGAVGAVGGVGAAAGAGGVGGCGALDCDGDGWTVADGDCCDEAGGCSTTPELVNPGAIEYIGNAVDDDCDGLFDEVDPPCDALLTDPTTADAFAYAEAMDLCQRTDEMLPLADRVWGLIEARLSLTDGSGSPNPASHAVRGQYGDTLFPIRGQRFAILSTGVSSDPDDSEPVFEPFQPGKENARIAPFPQDWYQANGFQLPNSPDCPPPDGNLANDPVMLTLRIRVPTNARSFSFNQFFLSAEFPEYVCTEFNDFLIALIDSGATTNPLDKNLAVYIAPNFQRFPIGVNLARGTNLFNVCDDGPTGCEGAIFGDAACLTGPSLLSGTGFDTPDPGCGIPPDASELLGGATGWLTTAGNVVPGEIMELRIALWDTSDAFFDSVVLLDNWVWNLSPAQPGTN